MMMNIFNSFNPSNFMIFSFIFINLLLTLISINLSKQSKFKYNFNFINNFIKNDFNKVNKNMMFIEILNLLFFFNLILNLSNMIPFSFCLNSQLNLFFFFSFIIWLATVLFMLNNWLNNFILHLTPIGCPILLSPIMVLIELISLLIRPMTLSVRMSANMLAGHLLIHLTSEFSFFMLSLNYMTLMLSMLFMLILNLLELGVAMIQPYIFCTLLNMYMSEIN